MEQISINWTALVGVCVIVGAVITWFMRLEARLNSKLSIETHQKICDKARLEDKEVWADIRTLIVEANNDRKKTDAKLNEMAITLAVLVAQSGK